MMDFTTNFSVPFEIPEINHGLKVAKGLLKLGKNGIDLEYQVQDSFIGVIKSDVKNLHLPYKKLDDIHFKKGWFSAKIILEATSIRTFQEVPGAEHATCTFKIKRKHRDEAKKIVSRARLQLSEYKLEQLEKENPEN